MVRVALVIFIVLMVQQTVMVALRVGGAHPDLLWLLPITAALLDGPETGAIVGFWSGLAFDLVLPTPFGLSALVGCLLGYAIGVAHDGRRPPGGLAQAGGRARGERRSGHAVRRARRHPRSTADGAGRLPGPLPGRRRLERGAGAPGQPADAVGPGRREQPPLARLGPDRQQGSGEADPPPPDPRRPAAPQARRRARRAGRRGAPRPASRACGRARASTWPPSSARPRRRSRGPTCGCASSGSSVLVLFGVLVLRLWTLQVVEGKTYAAAVTRNQVRVVSVPAPRGEIVDRNGTVLVSNIPQQEILLSRAEAAQNPAIIGMVAALGRPDARPRCRRRSTTTSTAPTSRCRSRSASRPPPCSSCRRTSPSTPGVSVETVAQRTYPQGGTTATHVLGYVGDITSSYLAAHPNAGYTQGSQIGVSGIEAQYEPYLRGVDGRQALSVDASGDVVGTLSTTAPQIGDTVVLNIDTGLQQEVAERPAAADPGGPPDARQRRRQVPAGAQRRRRRDEPPERPGARHGLLPDLRPQRVGGRHLAGQLHRPAGERAPRTTTPSRASTRPGSTFKLVTATAALQDGLIAPGTPYDDTGTFKITGCPAPGVNNDTGCILTTTRATAAASTTSRGALTVSSDAFFYNLGDDVLAAARHVRRRRRSRTRRPPTARGPSPASTCPARRRAGRQLPATGPSCTPRRPRRSPTPRRGTPATTSRWPSARARPC